MRSPRSRKDGPKKSEESGKISVGDALPRDAETIVGIAGANLLFLTPQDVHAHAILRSGMLRVATRDGKIIGFYAVFCRRDHAEVRWFAVLPDQPPEVGHALVEDMKALMADRKVSKVTRAVDTDGDESLPVLLREGFRPPRGWWEGTPPELLSLDVPPRQEIPVQR